MKISFGIVYGPECNIDHLKNLVYSIQDQQWESDDEYEIILCGGILTNLNLSNYEKCFHLFFPENAKTGWITKKKNLIVKEAKFENIVLLHDYYLLDDFWFKGFKYFDELNTEWKVIVNAIINVEGNRHSDWLINQKYMDILLIKCPELSDELMKIAPNENGPRWVCGLPYTENLSKIQYISGGMIVAKKEVLKNIPLNEELTWGQAEDIEWSERLSTKYGLTFNPYSSCSLQKPGKWHVYEMADNVVNKLKEIYDA